MKKLLWVFLFLSILPGCKKQVSTVAEVYTVLFSDKERENHSLFRTQIDSIELIPLDTAALLGFIEKIIVKDGRMYAKDPYINRLFVYNLDGTYLNTIGRTGRGPEEFLGITDFYVADESVYVYDGKTDRMLQYGFRGNFVQSDTIPFKADALAVADRNYFWALSSYNTGDYESRQVLITGPNGKAGTSWLDYPENTDIQFQFPYWFQTDRKQVAYNRPIDNNIYLFSYNGEQTGHLQVDFRSLNVDDSKKGNLAQLFESGTVPYAFMITPPVVTDRYIIGNINKNGEINTFTIDRRNGSISVCPMPELTLDNILLPMSSTGDGRIISCINMDMYPNFETDDRLPENMKQLLRTGGYIVILYTLKS
jgi:hypothetical protein